MPPSRKQAVLLVDQISGSLIDRLKGVDVVRTLCVIVSIGSHVKVCTHLKKLVQVGGNNAQIAQSFEQRYFWPLGPI